MEINVNNFIENLKNNIFYKNKNFYKHYNFLIGKLYASIKKFTENCIFLCVSMFFKLFTFIPRKIEESSKCIFLSSKKLKNKPKFFSIVKTQRSFEKKKLKRKDRRKICCSQSNYFRVFLARLSEEPEILIWYFLPLLSFDRCLQCMLSSIFFEWLIFPTFQLFHQNFQNRLWFVMIFYGCLWFSMIVYRCQWFRFGYYLMF